MRDSMIQSFARSRRRRRGLTLIEAGLVMGIVALVFGGLASLLSDSSENMRARSAADRMRQVAKAAEAYTNAYAAEIKTNLAGADAYVAIPISSSGTFAATGGAPAAASARSVQGAGFLPAYFVDKNQYGHYHALIIHNVPIAGTNNSRLEAIVTTVPSVGTNVIPDRMLGKVAQLVGGMGGYRLTTSLASGDAVLGAGGGWRIASPNSWGAGGIFPRKGTVQAALGVGDNGVLSDFLNRHDIGVPEANTMHATLTTTTPSAGDTLNIRQDGDGVLKIGPSISVPSNITSESGFIQAGNCNSALVGGDVQACHDVNAGNDINASRYSTASAFIDRGTAKDFQGNDRGFDPNSPATAYWKADPTDTTTLKKINIDELELVSNVPGDRFNPVAGETTLRLRDMLPRYVAKEGYKVTRDQPYVEKPVCNGGGDPRIFLTPMQDSWQVKTEDFIKAQTDLKNYLYWNAADTSGIRKQAVATLNCGGGTCTAGYSDFVSGDAISTVPAVTGINMSDLKFYRQYVAKDVGATCATSDGTKGCWKVDMAGTAQVTEIMWQALAMTYCFH